MFRLQIKKCLFNLQDKAYFYAKKHIFIYNS